MGRPRTGRAKSPRLWPGKTRDRLGRTGGRQVNDEEIVSPDGKTHAHRKFHIHVACVTFGVASAIAVSYIPMSPQFFSHFVLGMPIVPSLAQEVIDRVLAL